MPAIDIKTATKVVPQCYAYTLPGVPANDGWTKIGFTERDVETRINEQTHTAGVPHKTHWAMRAAYMTPPYGAFTDRDFHAYLKRLGVERRPGREWFFIDPNTAKANFIDFAQNHGALTDSGEALPYTLRSEQAEAVEMAADYFKSVNNAEFLWNAKPRFGKTLAAYDLCMRLGATNILIVTNRPAIANSWYDDYETFFGPRSGYIFVSEVDGIADRKHVYSYEQYQDMALKGNGDDIKGLIEFVSLQNLKGSLYFGGHIDKLAEVSKKDGYNWDVLIIDEAHEGVDTYKTSTAFNQINRKHTLHLSGTPFKALASEKFPQSAIFNWTYADEQQKKRAWDCSSETENPYATLPCLSLYTYKMSDIALDKAKRGIELAEDDITEYAFDLNEFFKTDTSGKFVHDAEVDKFLDALTLQEKFPFSTSALRNELKHTFWLLKYVSSAKALAKKLAKHPVFKDYEVVLAAGDGKLDEDDENEKSFNKVNKAIAEFDKTITLSVGQLTTGVTIPEWTAVLMLSDVGSPSLYMQAAFRAQNPCLFTDANGDVYRKHNAYVFDFDPARTLDIFEKFANDLIPDTAGDKGDYDSRKRHVRELLNYFPVFGEDDDGQMVRLDAEKVLTIPRRIHAREVVDRGFMSNFLFSNINNIFGAPKEIIDIINNMEAIEERKALKPLDVDEQTSKNLYLNSDGDVELPDELVIGLADGIFGDKVYAELEDKLSETVEALQKEAESAFDPEKVNIKNLQDMFSKPVADRLSQIAKANYGGDLKKSAQVKLERKIKDTADAVVNREYGEYKIRDNQIVKERDDKIAAAQQAGAPMAEITRIDDEYEKKRAEGYSDMLASIDEGIKDEEVIQKAAKEIVNTVETEKKSAQKTGITDSVRDHLRGFSRTIPAFLMAYGDENTTLANFDTLVPEDVFLEVTYNPQTKTGVSLEKFRMLRDGYDYTDEDGEQRHFDGHLFDEVVFNDAVKEFMKRRAALANYFEPGQTGDIFDYIPPQRTNQIFTPKKVVKDMVNRLEQENPGCFDDPKATFADLYMKSGMYITEIVTRLYRSPRMRELFPDDQERLNHIFSNQVFGCAPTAIIYNICRRYILGFSDTIEIKKDNIKLCDTLAYAKDGTMEQELKRLFGM